MDNEKILITVGSDFAKRKISRKIPTEEQIALWELQKGKRPYNGMGNLFRQYSQYLLMQKWEANYNLKSALEVPFDHATDGIDGNILSCYHDVCVNADETGTQGMLKSMNKIKAESYDFVWNFGFLQREPILINEMKRISKRYVAAFVPNYVNPGTIVHKFYHSVYGGVCVHPERGDKRFMCIHGLEEFFKNAGMRITESGYVDLPPFFDTVVTVKELFGSKGHRDVLKIPINVKGLLPFERISFPKRILAHHCYVVAEKQ